MSAWFAKSVVVWNPIIYALLSKSFRQKAVQLVRCSDASYVATRPQKATELGCATAESDCTIRPTRAINGNIL
ncbi:hypothetical protein DPMN_101053 [Dreissena polymorpha]|uniref:Uncharacterized protein n=2 Tax=Dreissena polymorpha TaxID=45954 RepID=A0A9D4LI14_DREPO|nr:hypothetical protein DPMN_101053 [Dreissena polymorpha]